MTIHPHGFRRCGAIAALLLGSAAMPLTAQQDSTSVIDRIVAVVGTRAILHSEVQEALFQRFPGGRGLPEEAAALKAMRLEILQGLVDEELLVQEATRDTAVKVSEEDVTAAVDALIRDVRKKYGSEEEYRKDLAQAGFQTPDEHRRWLTEQQRRQLLVQKLRAYLQQKEQLKAVIPTEKELRDAFQLAKTTGQLQKRPETVSLLEIVIAPTPPDSSKVRARAVADSIVAELRKGADFATAARRFSMDEGSKGQGGSLGWFRRGAMVPEFERVAFALRPGVVSDPVESPYGFHLIQVERVQPSEISARHILIMPDVGPVEAAAAHALADSVHAALARGARFDSLQRLYHDGQEAKEFEVAQLDKLPAPYLAAIEGVPVGGLAPVFVLEAPIAMRNKYAIVKITDRVKAGDLRYEDVKDQLRENLGESMAIRKHIDMLKSATFVEVREP